MLLEMLIFGKSTVQATNLKIIVFASSKIGFKLLFKKIIVSSFTSYSSIFVIYSNTLTNYDGILTNL